MNKLFLGIVAASVIGGLGNVALADRCTNLDIYVANDFKLNDVPVQIRVVDFDYFDVNAGKWREEAGVHNQIFNPSGIVSSFYVERDLTYVGNSPTIIRLQYQYLTATNGWSENLDAYSNQFICRDDRSALVVVSQNIE